MKQLIVLVGPPGSGKSTLAKEYCSPGGVTYINQDSQGKEHLDLFKAALERGDDIVVDRMGFSKEQRSRYLNPAKAKGYYTHITVLHVPYRVCLERVRARTDHETIKDEKAARSALGTFFGKYERVQDNEADKVDRCGWDGPKPKAIWSDLDGTLCNIEHRRHFVLRDSKKDWNGFFKEMVNDTVNQPVMDTLLKFSGTHRIVYCSGRPDSWRKETERWLMDKSAPHCFCLEEQLFMRPRNDSRQDDIVKQIILDFEVLTRYSVDFYLDDRDQVVKMLRGRGLTVFQVADGDF